MRANMSNQEKWDWACRVFGVDSFTPISDVKKQYRAMALKYHPDKHSGFEEQFKAVQNAHEILMDEEIRREILSGARPASAPRDEYHSETQSPRRPTWTDRTVRTVLAESRLNELAVSVVKEAKPDGATSYWIEVDDLRINSEVGGIGDLFFNKEFLEHQQLSRDRLVSLCQSVTDFLVKKIDENKTEMESLTDISGRLNGFIREITNEIARSKNTEITSGQFENFWQENREEMVRPSASTDSGTPGFDVIDRDEVAPGLATLDKIGMKLYKDLEKQVQDLAKNITGAKRGDKDKVVAWREKMDVAKIMMSDLENNNQTFRRADWIERDYPRAFEATIGKSDTEKLFDRYLNVRQAVKPGLVETAWNKEFPKSKPAAAEDRDREGEGGKGPSQHH